MKTYKQLIRHDPSTQTCGDSYRTALACLLEVPPEEVAHIPASAWGDDDLFHEHFDNVLLEFGYVTTTTTYGCSLPDLLRTQQLHNPGVYYLLMGLGNNGTNHVVIGCGNKIVWDPCPDESGIIGPCETGVFYVSFLVSIKFFQRNLQ